MASTEKRTARDGRPYYRARYVRPDGAKGTVKGSDGKAIRYPTKVTARKAAQKAEDEAAAAAGRGRWVAPERGCVTLAEYVHGKDGEDGWIARAQDLAESSAANYSYHLLRILPALGDRQLAEIDSKAVETWERTERASGAASSVRTYRSTLHLILEDAVAEGLITVNPARRRAGRGKRAGRASHRGPEKAHTDALGILLTAERAALLAGREDEFAATLLMGYTGMRWGEVVGLEAQYVRAEAVRVEGQLYELAGRLIACPPKDDSYRTIDAPRWLTGLMSEHIAQTSPQACACHGQRYAFRGRPSARGATLAEVAARAGVSPGTASDAVRGLSRVAEATRARVEHAVAALGYVRGGAAQEFAPHWLRSPHAAQIMTPAATGWYPPKAPRPRRPVQVRSDPFPGVPARGRGADSSWAPIRNGLTRHGLRHSHRTLMEEVGTAKVLMDERMGHIDGSVSARYAHVTDRMRRRLTDDLTEQWHASLDARIAMHPRSPVPGLDRLLLDRAETR